MIEADKKPEEIRQEPVELHKDFRWVTVNLSDPNEVSYHSDDGIERGQLTQSCHFSTAQGSLRTVDASLRRGSRRDLPLRLLTRVYRMVGDTAFYSGFFVSRLLIFPVLPWAGHSSRPATLQTGTSGSASPRQASSSPLSPAFPSSSVSVTRAFDFFPLLVEAISVSDPFLARALRRRAARSAAPRSTSSSCTRSCVRSASPRS